MSQSLPKTSVKSPQGSYWGSFYMVLAVACFFWMGVWIKQANLMFGLHAYELVFWRVAFACVALGVQACFFGRAFKTSHIKPHLSRSVVGTLSLFMFFYGITHLPLATAVTFTNTSTIFLAILSWLILGQRPSLLTWLALLVGLLGVGFILRPTFLHAGILPTLIGLCAGLFAGYAYLMVRELSVLGEPAWRIVFYFSLTASVLSGVVSAFIGFTPISTQIVPYLLGIGLSAMAGQLLMTHAYKVGRKFMVATLSYLGVVASAIYGAIGFGEILPTLAIVGICLVIASGVLSGIKE